MLYRPRTHNLKFSVNSYILFLVNFVLIGFTAGKVISSMVLGKIFITIVFDGVYVYSSELFPTVVRYAFKKKFNQCCHPRYLNVVVPVMHESIGDRKAEPGVSIESCIMFVSRNNELYPVKEKDVPTRLSH